MSEPETEATDAISGPSDEDAGKAAPQREAAERDAVRKMTGGREPEELHPDEAIHGTSDPADQGVHESTARREAAERDAVHKMTGGRTPEELHPEDGS